MKYLSYIIVVCTLLCTISCTKERASIPLSNYLDGEYKAYRIESEVPVDTLTEEVILNGEPSIDTTFIYEVQNSYYTNQQMQSFFLTKWGQPSGNIWDFTSDGIVNVDDLLLFNTGWGLTYDADYDIYSATVASQFSSGWVLGLSGWDFCFLKVTPSDEGGVFIPETLNSFFLEGERDGANWKVWYHATE